MTLFNRHSAHWSLLTTLKLIQPFHLEKNSLKSFAPKILPVSLARSRLCKLAFELAEWHQDFTGMPGGGGPLVVDGRLPAAREAENVS